MDGVETPMTASNLASILVDDFHDWIDGDDWPVETEGTDDGLCVKFASGRIFNIMIDEL